MSELRRAVPPLRAFMVWLIVFAFAAQAQIAGGHVHPPKLTNDAASTTPSHGGHTPKDPRSDSQCVFCQQFSSAQPFVSSAAPEFLVPIAVSFGRLASAEHLRKIRVASFAWLSRAPPAA